MPRDGSLVAQPIAGSTSVAPNTTILSSLHNNEMLDIYGLFNTQWPVAIGGSGATSGTNFSDINNTASILRPLLLDTSGTLAAGGTATAVTVTASRAYTAYGTAAGQLGNGTMLSMRMASAAVSGGTTLAVSSPSSLGTKPVLRQGGTAIGNMDWLANTIATFVYTTAAAYNSGNGAWVLLAPSVAGMGGFDDGAVGTPGIYFSADPDTGIYRSGTNTATLVAGGANILTWNTSGISITGVVIATSTIVGGALAAGTFSTTGATAGTSVSAGRINQSVAVATASVQGAFYNTNGLVLSFTTTNTDATITAAGVLNLSGTPVSLTGGQLKFPATQVPSADANTLDDYEEGSWSPGVGGTATYTSQLGRYIKVGKQVTSWGNMGILAIGTGSTSLITNAPFTSATNFDYSGSVAKWSALAASVYSVNCYVGSNSATVAFTGQTVSGGASSGLGTPAIFASGTNINFTAPYEAAA